VQVLPFSAGGHPAMTGPFMLIKFPDALDEPIVYLDNFTRGQVLEEPEHFTAYQDAHARLRELALAPKASLDRIRSIISNIS
ncbi:DNA-binding protein, partial [Thermoactinomyces vulgaris]